ncbi:hypothetical protein Tco_0504928 [Tanacetum coccineum]
MPEYYCLSITTANLSSPYYEPLIASKVNVSVVNRSIGTDHPRPEHHGQALSLDHVFDFPANDPALELEDPVMEVEEDPKEYPEEDQVTPPNAVSLTSSETPPLPSSIPSPLPIDPIMLPDYQITTQDFLPWITLTRPSTFDVGGPSSSAVPVAPHPVGCPLSVVGSAVAQHHQKIRALYVRTNKMESI